MGAVCGRPSACDVLGEQVVHGHRRRLRGRRGTRRRRRPPDRPLPRVGAPRRDDRSARLRAALRALYDDTGRARLRHDRGRIFEPSARTASPRLARARADRRTRRVRLQRARATITRHGYVLSPSCRSSAGCGPCSITSTPRLFEPLGHRAVLRTCWSSDPRGIDMGGFGLTITTRDLAAFGQLFLQRGVVRRRPAFSRRSASPRTASAAAVPPKRPRHPRLAAGLRLPDVDERRTATEATAPSVQFCLVLPRRRRRWSRSPAACPTCRSLLAHPVG